MPVEDIVATVVIVLLHVPPVVASVKLMVVPVHRLVGPVIDPGPAPTVTTVVAIQPAPSEYVIVVVPIVPPVRIPVVRPIVATVVVLLVHVPPVTASLNVMVPPMHTPVGPRIDVGEGLTLITVVVQQPVGNLYVIVAVPRDTPVTIPLLIPTVATDVLLLVHVPPAVGSLIDMVAPTQTAVGPVIVPGSGFTVTVIVAAQPVGGV